MVISHQLIGSISTEFKEVKRIFGLENLVKSAKGFYNYSNDNDIFGHVNKAFDDLWFSTTNLGRNVMADFEELNTIDTFSGFLLLLFIYMQHEELTSQSSCTP
ncbi:Uncharacterised protein [[Flavobacterium] thermophilum]|nr:Uncharacterised protein [[Flavobacterium] thermophilum]STO36137.1 Uncharacterised protein [[Flavobacterium] thermophilum]